MAFRPRPGPSAWRTAGVSRLVGACRPATPHPCPFPSCAFGRSIACRAPWAALSYRKRADGMDTPPPEAQPMSSSSFANRWNLDVIDAAYQRWRADPSSVDEPWRLFFEGFELGSAG